MSCCRRPIPTAKETAAGLLRALRNQYDRVPEYRDVEWPKHLTGSRFHQSGGDVLGALGFTFLGDFQETNPVPTTVPDVQVFDRVFRSPDGTTLVTLRQLDVPLGWRLSLWAMGVPRQVVTFRSASANGDLHTTSNEPLQSLPPTPGEMTFEHASLRSRLADIYDRHRQAVTHLPRPLRRFTTRVEAKRLALDVHARIRAHLNDVGWVTREWLDARFSPVFSCAIYDEFQLLVEECNQPVSVSA
jgi:hypothetical protein